MAIKSEQIRINASYSNGEFGNKWTVWYVASIDTDAEDVEIVRFRILVGDNRRKYSTLPRHEFASKVSYEVAQVENSWHRVE